MELTTATALTIMPLMPRLPIPQSIIVLSLILLPACQSHPRLTPLTADSQALPLCAPPLSERILQILPHGDRVLVLTPDALVRMDRQSAPGKTFIPSQRSALSESPALILPTTSGTPGALLFRSGAISPLSQDGLLPARPSSGLPGAHTGVVSSQGTLLFSTDAWVARDDSQAKQVKNPLPSPFLGLTQLKGNQVAALCEHHLVLWESPSTEPKVVNLPAQATSPPCFWKGSLYFGLAPRHLARWDLAAGKLRWKLKLSRRLSMRPQGFSKELLVMPQDQGLFWFLPSGTLKWWTPAQGQSQWDPLPYQDCALVVLKPTGSNNRLLVSDPMRETVAWIPLPGPLLAPPAATDQEVILPCGPPAGPTRLVNLRTVRIKSDPADIILPRRTLKLFFKPVNLEDPELKVSILGPDGQTLLNHTIPRGKTQELVWIPENPGSYRLVIHAMPRRGASVDVTFPLLVRDLSELLLNRLKEQRNLTTQEVLP